jgi:hypothetical protein
VEHSDVSQHAGLSPERWARFAPAQRVLMIANEMHRATKLMAPPDRSRLLSGYERVLQLADLTIQTSERPALRRELLRWRDLVAALYILPACDPAAHAAALRALLQLMPEAASQLPYLAPGSP